MITEFKSINNKVDLNKVKFIDIEKGILRFVDNTAKSRKVKEQQGLKFLELSKVLKERFNTQISYEYLFNLLKTYGTGTYTAKRLRLSKFMKRLGYKKKDSKTANRYTEYHKLVRHKITDFSGSKREQEEEENYNNVAVSFVKSLGLNRIHLI